MGGKRKSSANRKSSLEGNSGLDSASNLKQGGMRIIAVKTLREFWEKHADSEQALKSWFKEATGNRWDEPNSVKNRYPSANILPGNRIAFNIKGNDYRLIVKIHYNTGIVYIRLVGTHAEYDKINAETI